MTLEHSQFLSDVEQYLRDTQTPATKFGIRVLKDPNFVRQLRSGKRDFGLALVSRVRQYIAANPPRDA